MVFRKAWLPLPFLMLGCPTAEDGDEASDTIGAETTSSTSSTAGTSGGESCIPGETEVCACPDGSSSTQICLSNGSGYSACACVGMTTADDQGRSGSSEGSSGSSGSGATDGDSSGTSTDGGSTQGPAPECDGAHPLVDGELRYCEPGNCYCGDFSVDPPFDVCYAPEIAESCCPVEVECY